MPVLALEPRKSDVVAFPGRGAGRNVGDAKGDRALTRAASAHTYRSCKDSYSITPCQLPSVTLQMKEQ